jgi:hypothetical protein
VTVRGVLLLMVATLVAGCGVPDGAPQAAPRIDPFEEVVRARPDPGPVVRAAPRWEEVLALAGDGPYTERFPIADGALQWRVRWACEHGTLALDLDVADDPLLEADCPEQGEAFAISTGWIGLDVRSTGTWQLTVEQQVDTAYTEPPLAGMDEAEVLATGEFYGVERRGDGTATLYRMPDGRLALRFTGFHTLASPDLFVWVSEAEAPATSEDAFAAPYVEIGALTSTLGEQNYVLPAELAPERVRSVVIWCAPVRIAYAAAALSPAGA